MRRITSLASVLVLAGALAVPPAAATPPPGAPDCPVLPRSNIWNTRVDRLRVHPRSDDWMRTSLARSTNLHPDFGPSDGDMPYGLPYETVPGTHPKRSVDFYYPTESDDGPYPFDNNTPIEGGEDSDGDRHALMIDRDNCILYELYDAHWNGGNPTGGSGAVFDLRSHHLRPLTWTSADAAGLPIFPGLLRKDEVEEGLVDHAIRFTVDRTDTRFIWPARHQAGEALNRNLPPMGARFRLKRGFSLAGYREDTKVILRAMKRYGLMLADNGSNWFFQGTAEEGWPTDLLDELKSIPASAFEAVDTAPMQLTRHSGKARQYASLSAGLDPRTIQEDRLAIIDGRLTPPHAGQRILLQRRVNGAWRLAGRDTLGASGRFEFRLRPSQEGVRRYRVRKPADGDHFAATSKILRLVVR